MHETGHSQQVYWDNPEGWDGEGGWRGFQDGAHMYTRSKKFLKKKKKVNVLYFISSQRNFFILKIIAIVCSDFVL